MGPSAKKDNYFTRHLFGAGIECPTKLYYYAQHYPENKQSRPFIEHAIYNKRLLTALARSAYPHGFFIDEYSIQKAAKKTQQLLSKEEVVLFDAIFEHQKMMVRLPIVRKTGDQLTAYFVRTKAFHSRKHRLTDKHGRINSKWRKYLLDFAYQIYLIERNWPDADIKAILVMPEKTGVSDTDNLPFLLRPLKKNETSEPISLSNQELLAKLDVTDLITKISRDTDFADEHLPQSTFEETITYLRDLYFNGCKEKPRVGLKCKSCEFRIEDDRLRKGTQSGFNACWEPEIEAENPSEYHVFDLIGPGTNQWIQKGVYDQRDIPLKDVFTPESVVKGKGRISHEMRQALQVNKVQGQEVPEEIFRPAIFQELNRWQYPLHFLDFEAGNYAVPVRKDRSPYDLVVFQFSCHTLQEDGSWTHHQWIDDLQNGYASYELVRRLMDVPQITEGTIVQYSDFERNALKTIRRELIDEAALISDADRLIAWIEDIIHRNDSSHHTPPYMADLSRLVKNFYYNREMGNSLSIKDVLRSVMSHSDFLKKKYTQSYSSHNFEDIIWWQDDGTGGARNPYKILMETGDSPIRRGTEAMVVYGKFIAQHLNDVQVQAYKNALLKYCELDTLAMVMIFQHWQAKMTARQ